MDNTRVFWRSLGIMLVCCWPALALAGDECTTPTPVALGANAVDTSTFTTGADPVPANCVSSPGAFGMDGWYSLPNPGVGLLTVDTCDAAGFDTSIAIYDAAGGCGALVSLACDGDAGAGLGGGCQQFSSESSAILNGTEVLLIRLGGFGATDSGPNLLNITFTGPSPEDCTNGIDDDFDGDIDCADSDCGLDPACSTIADECIDAVEVFLGANAFNTSGFTDSPEPDPDTITSCTNSYGSNGADGWLFYTATANGFLTLDTCDPASFDTDLSIYDGGCGALNILACDGDGGTVTGCQSFDSLIENVPVVAGTDYIIRIGGFSTQSGPGTLTLSFAAADDCQFAVAAVDGANAFDLTGATTDGPDLAGFCDPGPSGDDIVHQDTWFVYTATCTGDLNVTTLGTGFDTRLAAYSDTSCPADASTVIACDDDTASGGGFPFEAEITFPVVAGTDYLIQVGTFSEFTPTGPGTLTITCTAAPTSNDNCADTLAGPAVGDGVIPIDTTAATTDGPAPSCQSNFDNDVWVLYTASCNGEATFSTCADADFDTVIAVYPAGLGCALMSGDSVGCNDDNAGAGCTGNTSLLTISVTAGDMYLVQVGGWNGGSGTGNLTISCAVDTPDVVINEVRNNSNPFPDEEFCELSGPPGLDLSNLTLLTIGDTFSSGTTPPGGIDDVTPITGVIPASGYYVIAESSFGLGTPDQVESLNFEDSDNVTHLLVLNYTGPTSGDLDADDDGVFDEPVPWDAIVDSVALEAGGTDLLYSPNVVNPGFGAYRCGDTTGDFLSASESAGGTDTPGAFNAIPNDNLVDALPISVGDTGFCTLGATTDGQANDPLVCGDLVGADQQIHNDIWYCFTADCSGDYSLSTCNQADFDTRLAVYDGCGSDDPNLVIACNDDDTANCAGFTSQLTFTASGGNTYLIRVGGFSAAQSGTGTLSLDLGGNNFCDGAEVIFEGLTPFDTTCATTDGIALDPAVCDPGTAGDDQINNDIWYTYTATGDGTLLVSTCEDGDPANGSAAFDTRLAVYSNTSCPADPADVIACDDDDGTDIFGGACTGFTSALEVHVTDGQTYLIRVGGFNAAAAGMGELALVFTSDCDPVAISSLSADDDNGNAPHTVTLSAMATGTDPITWAWDSGDGQMSSDVGTTTFTYNTPGTYTATLTVTNDCGTDSQSITITVCEPLVAGFTSSINTGLAEACVDFTDATTGDVASYSWDFGNGGTSTDQNPSTTYPMAGTFTVELTVTGLCGRVEIVTDSILVLEIGDCNGDGMVDVADAISLADYLFGGGAAPACLAACDNNGDGAVDLGDVVHQLNTLFAGGPAAVAPPACTPCN